MKVSLDWLGCATFRLTIGELVVFLDAYIDRVPLAPDVGLAVAQVDRADHVLIGHAHFDHLWGAERIARNTGATVVGSHETVRLMRDDDVPEERCIAVAGGERVRLAGDVTVRVFPSLHSCIWARQSSDPAEACIGDLGLTLQDRHANLARGGGWLELDDRPGMDAARAHFSAWHHRPRDEGGALAFLIETPEGSILWKDTSGHWTGVLRDLRPDVAILAASGRGNVDGEPIQGSLAQFVAREAELLHPRRVILDHHDDWMPPITRATDVAPIRRELSMHAPGVELIEMGYRESYPVLAGIA
jgi:L-ascorbate metabolism protein UlaG (beta-lactamase superfamily)